MTRPAGMVFHRHNFWQAGLWRDGDLVFASGASTLRRADSWRSSYRELERRSDFKDIRLQDLRHTHAPQLIQAGENIKMVSRRLGHASVAFTLEVYGHLMPGMEQDAADRMDAMYGQPLANG